MHKGMREERLEKKKGKDPGLYRLEECRLRPKPCGTVEGLSVWLSRLLMLLG